MELLENRNILRNAACLATLCNDKCVAHCQVSTLCC